MRGILKSVLDLDGSVTQENLVLNFQKLVTSKIEWTQPADQRIYAFATTYFHRHLEMPAKQTLVDYFHKDGEVTERIKDLEVDPSYIRTNFAHLLQSTFEEQSKVKAALVLTQAKDIVTKGLTIDGETKKGLRDAFLFFMQNAYPLMSADSDSKIRGNLRMDGQEVWDSYLAAKADKSIAWGKFCGLNEIDKIVHGIKKGELWIHAAYTGELKTTFALNWVYNLVTRYRSNVCYVTLEMPYEQVRMMIYVMHSTHAKFKAKGFKPLDYDKVRGGDLSPEEELFYQQVIEDFCNNEDYGEFHTWGPDEDVTIDDIRMEAELRNQQDELSLLVIDHGGIVEPRKRKRSKDYVVELNSVLRDAKKLALHFNHGKKIPVLLLFQINREGKAYADKMEGRYKLSALSYANEAERSADIVSTTYLNDDHRRDGTTLFDCLKRRDGAKFLPFLARVDLTTKRIYNMDPFRGTGDRGMSIEDHRNVLDAMFSV